MGSIRAELVKLRRSWSGAVVVLLPLMAVLTGSASSLAAGEPLADGWHTLWIRVVVFYGLAPMAAGVAALASLLWRVEHQGGSWNALLGSPVPRWQVVSAKLVVLAGLVAVMQAVLVLGVVAAGRVLFDLPGTLPPRYLAVAALSTAACLPVAALQSACSMLWRSFAAPVATALVVSLASVGLVLAGLRPWTALVPHALLVRTTQLGSGVFGDPGLLTGVDVLGVLVAAGTATPVITWIAASRLDRPGRR